MEIPKNLKKQKLIDYNSKMYQMNIYYLQMKYIHNIYTINLRFLLLFY